MIMGVVEWFMKMRHYILCTAKEAARLVYSGGNTNGVQGGHEECQK